MSENGKGLGPVQMILLAIGLAAGGAIGHLVTVESYRERLVVPKGTTCGDGQLARGEDGSYFLSVSSNGPEEYNLAVRFESPVPNQIGEPGSGPRAVHLPRVKVEAMGPIPPPHEPPPSARPRE